MTECCLRSSNTWGFRHSEVFRAKQTSKTCFTHETQALQQQRGLLKLCRKLVVLVNKYTKLRWFRRIHPHRHPRCMGSNLVFFKTQGWGKQKQTSETCLSSKTNSSSVLVVQTKPTATSWARYLTMCKSTKIWEFSAQIRVWIYVLRWPDSFKSLSIQERS